MPLAVRFGASIAKLCASLSDALGESVASHLNRHGRDREFFRNGGTEKQFRNSSDVEAAQGRRTQGQYGNNGRNCRHNGIAPRKGGGVLRV